ncbi:MAG: DUF2117 domain-containing protein, partial [Methanomicrobiales archaeon]|nr:DUF2117 domain-containing protein [Methanomicrobiales archaeon]
DPPSVVIRRISNPVFLVNRGKTPESGRIFGELVARRLLPARGLLHLECSSRTLYLWNQADTDLARALAEMTGFHPESKKSPLVPHCSHIREIRGCLPGEAVCINGLVIGYATAKTVIVQLHSGEIKPVSGLIPKQHGIKKLHRSGNMQDLDTAWCKSGRIRARHPSRVTRAPAEGRVIVIDHDGQHLYSILDKDTCGILSIGDDTTGVCGHIGFHRGIPVFGIVDGDADHLLETDYAPGSVIVQVEDGMDDIEGRRLAAIATGVRTRWDEWVSWALSEMQSRGTIVYRS